MKREEFIDKYGDVEVTFSSYYKYTFTYSAKIDDGKKLTAHYGGDADEIYKTSVASGEKVKIKDLYPYAAEIYKGRKEIESFYDY